MRESIKFTISKNSEQLHEESFVVPHELETLYIDVKIQEQFQYMGFIIVMDSAGTIRLQKLLGYGAQKLAIGNDGIHTTIGGVPGKIAAGKWTLYLGIFTEYVARNLGEEPLVLETVVTDEKTEITEPMGSFVWVEDGLCISKDKYDWNRLYQPHTGWYMGDFHTHTRLSDGKETVAHAMEKAAQMGMDFYVPTEHNLMHTGWCDTNLCILPGIEITTDMGHFNLFGIDRMPEHVFDIVKNNGTPKLEPFVLETIKEANERNYIVSLNHPFLTIWKWQYGKVRLNDFQCVEIINDPTYQDAEPSNEKAIAFLDTIWQDGHTIWGVGGSDSHNLIEERYEGADLPSVAGDPATYVLCEGLSPNNLMNQVRKGHMCVTRFCKIIPTIRIGQNEYLPGDELLLKEESETLSYEACISGLKEKPDVFLVKNGKKKQIKVEESAAKEYFSKADIVIDAREYHWVRLEVRTKQGKFLGYVNPVWCGKKNSSCETVEEIWGKMGEI